MNPARPMIGLGGSSVGAGSIDESIRHALLRDDPSLAKAAALIDEIETKHGHLADVVCSTSAIWSTGPLGFDFVSDFMLPFRDDIDMINARLVAVRGGTPRTNDEIMACWVDLLEAHLKFNRALGIDGPFVF